MIGPPPSPTGETSPPSDMVGGSRRLLERPGAEKEMGVKGLRVYVLQFVSAE